ncbi:lantibiotic dehydratase [Streptantibioticus rubrisoli]|uniref:Lantibiotic dehydratase n=1 Tax=Streptantibioticus rubrisoli TaxID=1387313 RepID=A0ABT1PIP2_9ACTN|nr:lantibiotic dehydratase [Streptantibioticus rubrisoli]MCQ4045229.1 lantibiotic dehydratase [Streptantibioticus rubrisoli]
MLRAPVHPVARALDTIADWPWSVGEPGTPESPSASRETAPGAPEPHARPVDGKETTAAELASCIAELADDPLVREALAVSSPSLAREIEAVRASGPRSHTHGQPAGLVRVLRALAFYRLRMSGRPTPFGLMAGVSGARLTDDLAEVRGRLGTAHRRAVRPDRGWLTALVAEWERRPHILRGLRLVANNLCFARNGRVVLPYVPDLSTSGPPQRTLHEVSVRHTAAVRTVLRAAHRPTLAADLADRLLAEFPQATPQTAQQLLAQLVEKELLLTELRPPLECADPLGYVRATLERVRAAPAPSYVPASPPEPASPPHGPRPGEFDQPGELDQIDDVRQAIRHYAAQPLGRGQAAWRAMVARMRDLCPAEHPAHVDLLLDADVRLPRTASQEVARAASLLWRLSPTDEGSPALRQYHADFLERYGQGRAVPVKEALDPDVGLGAPAGYRWPPSSRPQPPEPPPDTARARLLAALAQEATLTAAQEVVLTDDHPLVIGLARDEGRAPDSFEVIARVIARSARELAEGCFQLVLHGVSPCAGAAQGRFWHLLPDKERHALNELARLAAAPNGGEAVPVQLSFSTSRARHANVTQVPLWLDRMLTVAAYCDPDDPRTIGLDALALHADLDGLHLVDAETGREVRPRTFHMLNVGWNAPNAARLLSEIAYSGVRAWQLWHWGTADALPYLPRVRYGRTVLCEARWRPGQALQGELAGGFARWGAAVAAWRQRWHVPERVCLAYADQRTELDLTCEQHLALLRHELGRRPETVLQESRAGECGWLAGPGGAHTNEVVFPLVRKACDGTASTNARIETKWSRPRPAVGRPVHPPGGEWLYAALFCSAQRHEEVLATQLPAFLDTLPTEVDRWFFLRYADPRTGPHLRLRLHAPAQVLAEQVLPALHAWTARLRSHSLAHRLVLDTYEPELERYGGPEAIEAAEQAFHADSRMVLAQLQLLANGELTIEPVLLAGANHVDMVRRFCGGTSERARALSPGGDPPWLDWMLATFPRKQAEHREFQRRRAQALAIVDPYDNGGGLAELPGGAKVLRLWEERAAAIAAYSQVTGKLAEPNSAPAHRVLPSLLHMHANRLLGMDRDAERASYAIARGALQAHRDRRVHGGNR